MPDPLFEEEGDHEHSYNNARDVLEDVLGRLRSGQFEKEDVLDAIHGMLDPGHNDNSFDIRSQLLVGLILLGRKDIAEHIHTAWLQSMPWGIGISFGVEQDFDIDNLDEAGQEVMGKVIGGSIVSGGVDAEAVGTKIRMNYDGSTGGGDISDAVTKFRQEIDEELGPDAPTNEGWSRWGL